DRRVSRRTRTHRSHRASQKNARSTLSASELFRRGAVNYRDALSWLYGLQQFGIKLGLGNIRRLIEELHVNLGEARVIHVAGTNGKGSVCAMIDAIARAHGDRTGLYTSPHLVSFRERIRVNGEMISEDETAARLTRICSLVSSWDPHPTFFEIA